MISSPDDSGDDDAGDDADPDSDSNSANRRRSFRAAANSRRSRSLRASSPDSSFASRRNSQTSSSSWRSCAAGSRNSRSSDSARSRSEVSRGFSEGAGSRISVSESVFGRVGSGLNRGFPSIMLESCSGNRSSTALCSAAMRTHSAPSIADALIRMTPTSIHRCNLKTRLSLRALSVPTQVGGEVATDSKAFALSSLSAGIFTQSNLRMRDDCNASAKTDCWQSRNFSATECLDATTPGIKRPPA